MEETKVDKRTKEYKEAQRAGKPQGLAEMLAANESEAQSPLNRLISTCMPIVSCDFQSAVNSASKTAENAFSRNERGSRKAEIFLTPNCNLMIFRQNGRTFATSAANCRNIRFD